MHGLRSSISLVCKLCYKKSVIESDPPHGDDTPSVVDVNTAAVSGITAMRIILQEESEVGYINDSCHQAEEICLCIISENF